MDVQLVEGERLKALRHVGLSVKTRRIVGESLNNPTTKDLVKSIKAHPNSRPKSRSRVQAIGARSRNERGRTLYRKVDTLGCKCSVKANCRENSARLILGGKRSELT